MMTTREQCLSKLRETVRSGSALLGVGAGTGISAKFAETGGADLIIIYNSGRYRMAGRGSLAGLMPYGDANQIVVEMAAEVLPVQLPADLRQRADAAGTAPRTAAALEIGYDPSQLRNPQVAIATYAQGLAHHLAAAVGELPPGGRENWYQVTEVVAVYLGFGIMLSNTAFTFRPGCGGCGVAGRDNALSEFDITYSLAIFCALKGLDANAAVPHLKRSLRGYFKRALKQVTAHRGRLSVH